MTDTATPAPAPAQSPGAAPAPPAQANHAADARAKIEALKADGEWTKRYLSGDVNAVARWKELHQLEANAGGRFQVGGMSPQEQRDLGAARLAELGLPEAIVEHHRSGGTVSAEEFRLAQARWDSQKMDPEWRAKLERGDYETKQEYAALLAIRCSRIAV
jgi:hypothetical protein